ncbi:hypothetical protein, partial [Paraburkholderia sp. BCC1885]|uniref:hypothetical protein n=1 Tax=Paraburkholderia sp. BCC1885 TaxID=2562669 RepID=UPI001C8FF8A6
QTSRSISGRYSFGSQQENDFRDPPISNVANSQAENDLFRPSFTAFSRKSSRFCTGIAWWSSRKRNRA